MKHRSRSRANCRVTTRRKGSGLINTLINKLPVELHLPGYRFCGPGTRLQKRLVRGDRGINPLDEACKDHDIAYARSNNLTQRHKADKILAEKAWERFRSKDASFGEKASALTIAGVMKGKTTVGMGGVRRRKSKRSARRKRSTAGGAISFKSAVRIARKRVGGKLKSNIKRTARIALAALKNKIIAVPKQRIIPIPKKGGIIPLIPLFAALGALGSLGGGAAAVAKAVKDSKVAEKTLEETKRHNKAMEDKVIGRGLFLRPYKKGLGVYLKSYPKNYQ